MKKSLLILIISLSLIGSGLLFLYNNRILLTYFPFFSLFPKSTQNQLVKPPNIANTTPVAISTDKGTIASFNKSILAIETKAGVRTFNISQTSDFQGVVSGSLENGDVITVKTDRSDLKVGKEVFVIVQRDTNIVNAVYIFR